MSLRWPIISSMLERIMLMLVNLLSTYIQPYGYKKSSLKSKTTENVRLHKIPRKNFVLWSIQIHRIWLFYNCTQANSTHQISLKAGNCSSTLCNTIIGSLVERNWILLCKLYICLSLMTVLMKRRKTRSKNKDTVHYGTKESDSVSNYVQAAESKRFSILNSSGKECKCYVLF